MLSSFESIGRPSAKLRSMFKIPATCPRAVAFPAAHTGPWSILSITATAEASVTWCFSLGKASMTVWRNLVEISASALLFKKLSSKSKCSSHSRSSRWFAFIVRCISMSVRVPEPNIALAASRTLRILDKRSAGSVIVVGAPGTSASEYSSSSHGNKGH